MTAFHYDLEVEPCATGAQGAVYFGDRDDGMPIAVKVAAPSGHAVRCLEAEVGTLRAIAAAGVQGVVPCLDVMEVHGRPAMVMPRYRHTLRQWLDRAVHEPDADTLPDALRKCARIARILGKVHKVDFEGRSIVHRDVKPENIFVDDQGEPILGDFGGAMVIDGLKEIELALFGTPMWAPFDQILPGRTIPDPTWDTYALCVLLYAAITGARPAYQADPRELLTNRGRSLWATARKAIESAGDARMTMRREFMTARQGAAPTDLVDLTGRSALNEADRAVLHQGLARLTALSRLPDDVQRPLERALWSLLSRGLSPVSHPSPPNRFRDGEELADQLEDLLVLMDRTEAVDPMLGPMAGPDISIDTAVQPAVAAPRFGLVGLVAIGVSLVSLAGIGLVVTNAVAGLVDPQPTVLVPASTVTIDDLDVAVAPFRIDRYEVSYDRWHACTAAGACQPLGDDGHPELPVTGMPFAQAVGFCAWAGGHLPTEAEWRAAAGSTIWPWGEGEPTCARANALGCSEALDAPGRHRSGRSRAGVEDLAGNAWEWVRVGKGGERGVLMGGSYLSPADELGQRARLVPRAGAVPDVAGLRCAYAPEPG